jgi:hypothetical protein
VTPEELARAVDRLVDQVAHWTSLRWAARSALGDTRAEVAHAFAQELADLEARASGRAPRPVPRLASDLAIPDQWRVLVRDFVTADPGPTELAAAASAVSQVRAALFPGG